jgi:hypothetical protein
VYYSIRSSPSRNCLERVQQQGQKADPGKNKEARGKKRGRQGCGRSFFHVAREAKDNFWQSTFRQAVGRQHPAFACLSLTSSSRRTRRAAEMSLPKASRPGEFPFSFVRAGWSWWWGCHVSQAVARSSSGQRTGTALHST